MTTTGKVQRKELRKREEAKLAEGVKRILLDRCRARAPRRAAQPRRQSRCYGARITLVTPDPKQVYSGMLPGVLAGHYRRAEAQIDVAALAERAYVEFEQGEVRAPRRASAGSRRCKDGRELRLRPRLAQRRLAGRRVAARRASTRCAVKPFERFPRAAAHRRRAWRWSAPARPARSSRWRCAIAARGHAVFGAAALPPALARARAAAAAPAQGRLPARHGGHRDRARAGGGRRRGAAGVRPGAARHRRGGAAVAARLRAGARRARLRAGAPTLQSVSHPEVFALGDCATLRDAPHPEVGRLRGAPRRVAVANLRRLFASAAARAYVPQKQALLLLTCGARYAIAQRGGWSAQGRWVWWWKNRIDRRWMRSLALSFR